MFLSYLLDLYFSIILKETNWHMVSSFYFSRVFFKTRIAQKVINMSAKLNVGKWINGKVIKSLTYQK